MIESITEQADTQAAQDLKKSRRQKGSRQATMIDRLPPHSVEAEQGILGCALLDPNFALDAIEIKFSRCGSLAFYDLRHQEIYTCLTQMRANLEPVDLITVQQKLKDQQKLEQIGGIAYLSQLQDAVPSAANVEYYADIVLEKYTLRQYVTVCSNVVGKVYDYEGEVETLSGEIERDILAISSSQSSEVQLPTPGELVNRVIANVEAAWASDGQPTGLTTGLRTLDTTLDGLHNGEMIVVAARPSMGKTALAMGIAEHVAIERNEPVGIFSLEMTAEQLMERMMGSVARVNMRELKRNRLLAGGGEARLTSAAGQIAGAPLFIDDTSGLSILQLRARARRMKQEHDIKLFVIDYLQLLHSSTVKGGDNREREIADISGGIKAMAKELNVPVIVLSQLNRESEKTGGRPKLSQLRESGAIEQDADVVGLLYQQDNTEEPATQGESDAGLPVVLFIAKQRNGERNVPIYLTFLKHLTRFELQAPSHGIPEVEYRRTTND
ncbi:MAG: replicative DNA helicase [Verrucomicrobiota bacterium]